MSAQATDSPRPRKRPRTEVRRVRERGRYDRETVHAILDAGMLAHVGFTAEHGPVVIPMLYARDGDVVLLHGSIASRLMRALADGIPCCIAVTHVDGLVLARSQFHHSTNYRSVVVFGTATPVLDERARRAALARFVDALVPGRAADSRPADAAELAATAVLSVPIAEASAKIRSGGPKDHPDDLALPHWAGVLPLALTQGAAQPADDLDPAVALPPYLAGR